MAHIPKDDQTLPLAPANQSRSMVPAGEPSVAVMLKQVLDGGVTADSVGTLERMIALYERMEDKKAERAFAEAYVRLQRKIPQIKAMNPVVDKHGKVKYKIARLEDIDAQLRPLALSEGFTYWWSEAPEQRDGRVTKLCHVQHEAGHKRVSPFTVRIGSGPPNSTESQADVSAHSFGKRGSMCDAFSIIIEHSDDASNEGATISAEQAEELRKRVRNLEVNEAAYLLAFAEGGEFEDITRWDDASAYLDRVARKKKL